MDYYKGIFRGIDEPRGGGSYVDRTHNAHEKYNFEPVFLTEDSGYPEGDYCLGFVETKSTTGEKINQLRIENIDGCELCKKEKQVDDVLVIYCALYPDAIEKETYVVGWYKHATVYRNYEVIRFLSDGEIEYYDQSYNAIAKKSDCVLLPRASRRKATKWKVPRKTKGISYGFGQSNVWYAQGKENNEYLRKFLDKIINQIEEYDGENWLEKYPDINYQIESNHNNIR